MQSDRLFQPFLESKKTLDPSPAEAFSALKICNNSHDLRGGLGFFTGVTNEIGRVLWARGRSCPDHCRWMGVSLRLDAVGFSCRTAGLSDAAR